MRYLDFSDNNRKSVVPIRIKEARMARGYSLNDLAEKLDLTKQIISKYETGLVKIPIENLIKVSELLNFPIAFFYKDKKCTLENSSEGITFFRSLRSTSKKTKISLEQNIEFMKEIYSFIQNYIEFPSFDIPEDLNLNYKIGIDDEYIDDVALKLRQYWGLGSKPINNLTNLLLKKGIIITRIELKSEKVDAFSKLTSIGIPFVVLGSDKDSAVRSRMDLAHELGHIILHSHLQEHEFEKNYSVIENEAKKFASAFLLPAEEFVKDIYTTTLDAFVYLKEKWKVSIAGMIVRAHSLNIVSDDQYTYLFKQISMKRWRTKEPLDDIIKFERPNMFKEAIELLIENDIITAGEFLDNIGMDYRDIENLCFLPEGYFENYIENINKPKLKIIK